jgi:hypothetical protein
MRSRPLLVLLLALGLIIAVACEPPAPRADDSQLGHCRADPFASQAIEFLAPLAGPHHLTASVFDDRTGCWYHYRPGVRVTTASVLKMEILAGVELRAQNAGRGLSMSEFKLAYPMIRVSDNHAASTLFASLGGAPGLTRVSAAFGLTATNVVGPVWGLSSTTADDQAAFVERLVQGPGPLDHNHRAETWAYLRSVRDDQRWGITAGVPGDWAVGQKNGFAASDCCGWRVNSSGYVSDPTGGGYAITILSDGWPSEAAGIPTVEAVSRAVAAVMTAPIPAT